MMNDYYFTQDPRLTQIVNTAQVLKIIKIWTNIFFISLLYIYFNY